MSDHTTTDKDLLAARQSRRGFLGRAGLTLAAGLGMATVGAVSRADAAEPTKAARTSGKAGLAAPCRVTCYVERCNECASGRHLFRCVNSCQGTTQHLCYTRSCATFCASMSGC